MSESPDALPVPHPTPVSAPFWEAAARGELTSQRCRDCGRYVFIPQEFCRYCHSFSLEWVRVAGRGTVYSYSTVWRPQTPAFDTPYVVAIIELAEGYKMLSNLVECDETEVHVGMSVEVTFRRRGSEIVLPMFRPASRAEAGQSRKEREQVESA